MGRPKLGSKKIAFSVTLNSRDAILFRHLGEGNLSAGIEALVYKAREAGLIDRKMDKTVEANFKRNPMAAKEDDIFS